MKWVWVGTEIAILFSVFVLIAISLANPETAPNPYSVCGMYHPKEESRTMEFRHDGMTKLTGLVCFKPEEWSALPQSVKSEIEVWPGWRWVGQQ